MRSLRAIYVIMMRDLKRYFRQRAQVVGSIARPLLWLFVMGYGLGTAVKALPGGGSYVQFVFPGMIGMTVLFTSVFSAISVIWDREFGFLKEVLVAPIPRSSVVIGKALSGTVLSVIQGAIILALAPLVGIPLGLNDVLLVLAMMVPISFALTAFGLTVAGMLDTFEAFSTIMNFVIMPMFFLSGAMFPLERLPGWLHAAVLVNPLTYGVDALRGLMGLHHTYSLYLDFGVVAVFGIVMCATSVMAFSRKS